MRRPLAKGVHDDAMAPEIDSGYVPDGRGDLPGVAAAGEAERPTAAELDRAEEQKKQAVAAARPSAPTTPGSSPRLMPAWRRSISSKSE